MTMTSPPRPGDVERPDLSGDDGGDALTKLYVLYAKQLHRYLARRLDTATADDLVAETFLQAWRERHRYRPDRGTARAWLYGIATNLLRNHARSEVRGLRALAKEHGRAVSSEPPDTVAAARIDASSRIHDLAEALASLRPEERDVLMLVALAELSPAEAAQALGIQDITARTRLHRARQALRRSASAEEAPNE
jgi:RNA polymerase sigma factor (sigma-70 family)